ncbi:MAG: B12-binding domain-containing radical SAM protein [Candidatus Aenigmatarchaeota archaeon]|nr:MAG: B12-binding domain-containing radical SAM protein [Candidatus Aenigmarchaeota archaeon]
MKTLLLNPPFMNKYSRQSRSPCVTKGGTFYYPYFLAYATGAMEKVDQKAKLVDAVAREWGTDDTVAFAKSMGPGLVVIDTSTPSIHNDVAVAEAIKKSLPDAHISLVGTHPTHMPFETLKMSKSIDSVCVGEYDYTIRDLAEAVEKGKGVGKVEGIAYMNKGKPVLTKPREHIKNLDELPFVSEVYKRHLNIRDYFYASVRHPQVTILTARGCPFNCSFCNSPFKASYRARSAENVADEFEYIRDELPYVKEVMIEDETFPAIKKRTLELCNLLAERRNKVRWSCNARVDTDLETMKAMRKAGCRLMCVGFESPRQDVLNNIHKGTTKEMQMKFMKETRKAGLMVNGCFILGLPDDNMETMKETIAFAKELDPDTAQFYPIMVYPGLESYDWAKKNGYLTTEDYSKWLTDEGLHKTTISRPGLSDSELLRMCDAARREFYMRPSYIAKKALQSITKPMELKRNVKSFKTFVRYILKDNSK